MLLGTLDDLGLSDFYFLNVYYTVGFRDLYITPREVFSAGILPCLALYAAVLLLIGIPAYVDESSYLITVSGPGDAAGQRWYRGYNWIVLMQITQLCVAQSYRMFSLAMLHLFVLLRERNMELMPLYAPGCQLSDHVIESHQQESIELLPSCKLMERSVLGCELQSLFSSPHRVMLFSIILMSVLLFLYTVLYGRSFSTHCSIGRLYLALMVMCCGTLSLHFFGALPSFNQIFQHASLSNNSSFLFTGKESSILFACIQSLGIGIFGLAAIWSQVGDSARQNFVLLAAVVCFSDFGVSIAFSVVNVLRRSAVDTMCNFTSPEQYNTFMQLNKSATAFGNTRMLEVEDNGVSETAESIMMFRDTSGYVPWTVFLPFEMMSLAFTTMLICNYFFICDLQAATVFKGRGFWVLAMSVVRFSLLFVLEFLNVSGLLQDLVPFMFSGIGLTFFMLRMAHCVVIHFRQGFGEFLLAKRRLIPTENYIQLFAFDWYIGPAIFYLYNLGYPVICALALLKATAMLSVKSMLVFLVSSILPSSFLMAGSYRWPL